MKKWHLIITVLIFSLYSCNDVSEFLFDIEQSVEIRTVGSGSILQGGDSFPLSIMSDSAAVPDRYTVSIIDQMGADWGETSVNIENPDEDYTSSLIIPPELPTGKYFFHIVVFENDIEIASEEIMIFKADSAYLINELISLPQETVPGKDVFIQASVTNPPEVDPFFRWSLDGSILDQGYLSEGLDTLYWKAGDKSGLYSIKLEIFPEEVDSDLHSSVFDTVEIVVSERALIDSGTLKPDEDYTLLYHFAGDLNPENPEEFVNSLIGEVGALPFGNSYLYSIEGNNGIAASGRILPARNGILRPFSFNGRFSLSQPPLSGNILSIQDQESFELSIAVVDGGFLKLSLGDYESVSAVAYPYEVLSDLTVHVIPKPETTEIRWFINGLPAGETLFDNGAFEISETQQSLIGGDDLISGAGLILDELGVYTGSGADSTVDSDQYRRVLQHQLGSSLVDANGFDGPVSGLTINAGGKIKIADFTGSVKDMIFFLSFLDRKAPALWDLVFEDQEGGEVLRLSSDLIAFFDSDLERTVENFKIIRDENGSVLLESLEESEDFFAKADISLKPGQRYSLFLESRVENKSEVILDYFYIKTLTDSQLPQAVAATGDKESLL
ncbi:hypothetical protein [Spirochaeta isovalerica]|uniref:Uncharacterized protein n=1 Tax=Spirochaeta isovalerica TaxID=150 RepID=A0A841RHH0_9SPIO|nr:hypothetical protein [Spirochaeta isovalerica]MBB6482627.1 hypothetical protein [Spirochaeta isovalerica]